jgi:hypothetical protein
MAGGDTHLYAVLHNTSILNSCGFISFIVDRLGLQKFIRVCGYSFVIEGLVRFLYERFFYERFVG